MREKPIIATTLSGLFIKREPWAKAHIGWFAQAANDLQDPNVGPLAFKQPYFPWVDAVMKRLYPKLSDKERTIKARERFFEAVCKHIKEHDELINLEVIDYFEKLSSNHRIALVTTNPLKYVSHILWAANMADFFSIIESSFIEEKDDKIIIFERFIEKYGPPLIYIGGDRKDSYLFCKEKGINCVFANFEHQQEIPGIESVHSLHELQEYLASMGIN